MLWPSVDALSYGLEKRFPECVLEHDCRQLAYETGGVSPSAFGSLLVPYPLLGSYSVLSDKGPEQSCLNKEACLT